LPKFRLASGYVPDTPRIHCGYTADTPQIHRGCFAAAARLPCWLGLLAFAFAFAFASASAFASAFASRWAVGAVTRVHFVMLAAMAAVIVA
jgi:hypothetical protein